jgi:hypothetical protein
MKIIKKIKKLHKALAWLAAMLGFKSQWWQWEIYCVFDLGHSVG